MGSTLPLVWVDTHAHLQLAQEDPGLLLDRAREVDWVVVPGIDVPSSREALALAAGHGRVVAAVGLHPHEASQWPLQARVLTGLAEQAEAVGETGLDFYRNLSGRRDQLSAFRAQADLAVSLDKALIVHCRDAFSETFDVLEEVGCGPRSVMHCWTGGTRWTRRFLDLGVTFSFAGPLTFEGGETVRMAAARVPPGRALVETDTPYLTPPPHRDLPNEPSNVAIVGEALAGVWGASIEEVAEVTSETARSVFRK